MLRRLLKTDNADQKKNTLIITLTGEIKSDEELRLCGYELYSLNISGVFSLASGLMKLFLKIKKFKPDIIQTWLYHSDLIGGVVGRLAFAPIVIWNIRCEALTVQRAGLKTMLVFNLCKVLSYIVPSKIICVGEKVKNSHVKAGFCESRMKIIFNGYEIEKFGFSPNYREKFRNEFHVSDNEILIGCVGRYHRDKGQDILIKAAIDILADTEDLKFIFIGRGCSYENQEIRDCGIASNLKDKILMVGEKRNVAEILSSFDLYCMPSRSEGFPNSLAEAMLVELPCIASDVGDASSLSGGVLTLIEPNRTDLIVRKIREFMQLSMQERRIIGKKARERVVINFSIEKARDNFNSLYKELMER